ncbi:MAG: AzlC family ABC transporter permease [Ectothiorhodospiraceae bacterium]|nr:AzlC family ABC transporter permease [Ectothiorhodospiraceae bacterium]
MLVAVAPFGLALGALGSSRGLTATEMAAMSATVFAGAAQFAVIDGWSGADSAVVLTATVTALVVNLRHLMMGVALASAVRTWSPVRRAALAFLMVDETWALAVVEGSRGVLRFAWFMGAAIPFYLTWVGSGTVGAVVATSLGDPARLGLDFTFPAVFIVLLATMWNRTDHGRPWLVAAVASVVAAHLLPGTWYVGCGALAGALCAAFGAPADAEAG